ncbi:unnamed protein product, partial [Prorocentrum cordatum]
AGSTIEAELVGGGAAASRGRAQPARAALPRLDFHWIQAWLGQAVGAPRLEGPPGFADRLLPDCWLVTRMDDYFTEVQLSLFLVCDHSSRFAARVRTQGKCGGLSYMRDAKFSVSGGCPLAHCTVCIPKKRGGGVSVSFLEKVLAANPVFPGSVGAIQELESKCAASLVRQRTLQQEAKYTSQTLQKREAALRRAADAHVSAEAALANAKDEVLVATEEVIQARLANDKAIEGYAADGNNILLAIQEAGFTDSGDEFDEKQQPALKELKSQMDRRVSEVAALQQVLQDTIKTAQDIRAAPAKRLHGNGGQAILCKEMLATASFEDWRQAELGRAGKDPFEGFCPIAWYAKAGNPIVVSACLQQKYGFRVPWKTHVGLAFSACGGMDNWWNRAIQAFDDPCPDGIDTGYPAPAVGQNETTLDAADRDPMGDLERDFDHGGTATPIASPTPSRSLAYSGERLMSHFLLDRNMGAKVEVASGSRRGAVRETRVLSGNLAELLYVALDSEIQKPLMQDADGVFVAWVAAVSDLSQQLGEPIPGIIDMAETLGRWSPRPWWMGAELAACGRPKCGEIYKVSFVVISSRARQFATGAQASRGAGMPRPARSWIDVLTLGSRRGQAEGIDAVGRVEVQRLPAPARQDLVSLRARDGKKSARLFAALGAVAPQPKGGGRIPGQLPFLMKLWSKMRDRFSEGWSDRLAEFRGAAARGSSPLQAAIVRSCMGDCCPILFDSSAAILLDLEELNDSISMPVLRKAGLRQGSPAIIVAVELQMFPAPRYLRGRRRVSRDILPAKSLVAGSPRGGKLAKAVQGPILYDAHLRYQRSIVIRTFIDDAAIRVEGTVRSGADALIEAGGFAGRSMQNDAGSRQDEAAKRSGATGELRRLAKLRRLFQILWRTGSYPRALYGHLQMSAPECDIIDFRHCLAAVLATALGDGDPAKAVRRWQLTTWLAMRIQNPELHPRIQQARGVVAPRIKRAGQRKWRILKGPASAAITTLCGIGWGPVKATRWGAACDRSWLTPTADDDKSAAPSTIISGVWLPYVKRLTTFGWELARANRAASPSLRLGGVPGRADTCPVFDEEKQPVFLAFGSFASVPRDAKGFLCVFGGPRRRGGA